MERRGGSKGGAAAYSPAFSRSSVQVSRGVLLVIVALCVVFNDNVNSALAWLWAWLSGLPLVGSDTFEPILSVVAFSLWLNVWRAIDWYLPRFHRYRVDSTPQDVSWSRKMDSHSIAAGVAYLVPLFVLDCIFVGRRKLSVAPPTIGRLTAEVCLSVFLYDFFFYFCHLAMHRFAFLRPFHSKHHNVTPLRANEVLRLSFVDGSLQVLCNIIALRLVSSHGFSRIVHDLVVTYMLTETHSNYDLPFMAHNVIPFGLLGGSPKHHLHHTKGSVHFHQFFTWLDRVFGLSSD